MRRRFSGRILVTEDPEACWMWIGPVFQGTGFGQSGRMVDGAWRSVGAHRISWEIYKGVIPEGAAVRQKCGVKLCVNPDHLFLATFAEIGEENEASGKLPVGTANCQAKLTDSAVREIRAKYDSGSSSHRILAGEYGVHATTIGMVVRRDRWKHV